MHRLEFVIDAAHELLRSDDCNGSKGVISYILFHCNEENSISSEGLLYSVFMQAFDTM
jgi:hypothetical protein